ncbi:MULTISPECIES: hypothetical protein [Pseudoalteromonas]|uniref:Uncharacterized protein n=1 Tax=Pseudoalteromonas distincta TaxID=77608 RepID=A0ABT9G9S1_9GAMM|nr:MULTISPECIES: hypothetical protein [Pseudoalteromonas]KHM49906.1 hypothetical protein PL71_05385 [Pseudoalteromonas elyakovii]KID40633.1 hypothetical protein QT16_02130 [Pseudoalteromonas distincta]MBH0066464.1 hypothetical protein [Pseudoalteromonas sp. NZS100]MDP4482619.1 hypothetical protein [Pseudoalteromonas elyakovii]
MKHLKQQWKTRTSIVLIVSVLVSLILVTLERTDWAMQINLQGYSHGSPEGEKPNIAPVLMYILPFVKELILIGVPMLLTLGVAKLAGLIKGMFKNKA